MYKNDMRFVLLLIGLLVVAEFAQSAKNQVDEDDDDTDRDDSDEDNEDDDDDDSRERNNKHESNRLNRKNNKNRRVFGARLPGRVRLRGPPPMIPVAARPPILLLPPTVQLPQPVYLGANNIGVRQPAVFNFSAPGLQARGIIHSPFAAQPPMSAQAMNPGFSIANVRSAVIHNAVPAAPINTFVVTPQVTSFQMTPFPTMLRPQPKLINQLPVVEQHVAPALSEPLAPPPPITNSLDVIASPPMEPPPPPPQPQPQLPPTTTEYHSALADEIHCMRQPDRLTALLTSPPGYTALPFLSGRPDIDAQTSTTCRITQTSGTNVYQLELLDFNGCGVSSQEERDGKEWLSVSVRFPLVSGLKTPEDNVITIKCKPQDRTASANHAVDFHGNLVSPPATSRASVFLGQDRDLQCDLGLYRKAPGSSDYAHRVNAGSAIELGQELKLRASVKAGDGWNFVRLTDVIIYRVPPSFNSNTKVKLLEASRRNNIHNGNNHNLPPEATVEYAHLVLTDGCRNTAYKAIAPIHPEINPSNPLEVDFNFKAFMFQTMTEGEAVRITARVTACVEQQDCSIVHCPDGLQTNGRRKRDMSSNFTNDAVNDTTEFDRNLTVVVLTANNRDDDWLQREYIIHKLQKEKSCPALLVSTVALSFALAISWILGISLVTWRLRKHRQRAKNKWKTSSNKTLWTEPSETDKSFTKEPPKPTNNLNIELNPPKSEADPSLKRADSILRSLQTFIAASMFGHQMSRNAEHAEVKEQKMAAAVRKEPMKIINKDVSPHTEFNTFKAQERNNKKDELFIAMV